MVEIPWEITRGIRVVFEGFTKVRQDYVTEFVNFGKIMLEYTLNTGELYICYTCYT